MLRLVEHVLVNVELVNGSTIVLVLVRRSSDLADAVQSRCYHGLDDGWQLGLSRLANLVVPLGTATGKKTMSCRPETKMLV